MDNKEARFNLEFSFLEDPKILELSKLIDTILSLETQEDRRIQMLSELRVKWERVQEECVKEARTHPEHVKSFLEFVSYTLRLLSAGGVNLGRSRIGNFIDEKNNELSPYFDTFFNR
jgi:hypothetical protein